MDILIWLYLIPAFLTIVKLCKPIFNKFVVKEALKILNQNRQNGKHHGKEKGKG